MNGTMRVSSSDWRASSRACTSTVLVTTLPVTLEAAFDSQSPTSPVIGGGRVVNGADDDAAAALARDGGAELAARSPQRVEEIAEGRAL